LKYSTLKKKSHKNKLKNNLNLNTKRKHISKDIKTSKFYQHQLKIISFSIKQLRNFFFKTLIISFFISHVLPDTTKNNNLNFDSLYISIIQLY